MVRGKLAVNPRLRELQGGRRFGTADVIDKPAGLGFKMVPRQGNAPATQRKLHERAAQRPLHWCSASPHLEVADWFGQKWEVGGGKCARLTNGIQLVCRHLQLATDWHGTVSSRLPFLFPSMCGQPSLVDEFRPERRSLPKAILS